MLTTDSIRVFLCCELTRRRVLLTCAAALCLLIIPRWLGLASNFVFYDDFITTPSGHLAMHRFVQAAEKAFWFFIYGSDYHVTVIPKIASVVYIMVGVWAMARIFAEWKTDVISALLAVLIFIAHPITSDYLLWNTLSSGNLGWMFVSLGYLAQWRSGFDRLAGGVLLAFLGLGAYQLFVFMPLTLVFAEALLRCARGDFEDMPWGRRMLWALAPIVLYVFYLLLASSWLLGYSTIASVGDGGPRGFPPIERVLSEAFVRERYHSLSAGYFNVVQPVVSFYLGPNAAMRSGWIFWSIIVLSAPLFLAGTSVRRAVLGTALFLVMLTSPMAYHWFVLNASTGIRASIGALFVFCIWLAIWSKVLPPRKIQYSAIINLAALILVFALIPVTMKDSALRASGATATREVLTFIQTPPRSSVVMLETSVNGSRLGDNRWHSGLMLNYRPVSCETFSLVNYLHALPRILAMRGIALVKATEIEPNAVKRLNSLCQKSPWATSCGVTGVKDPETGLGAICFVQSKESSQY